MACSLTSFSIIGLRLFVLWCHMRVARKEVSSRGPINPPGSDLTFRRAKRSGGVRTLVFNIKRARIFYSFTTDLTIEVFLPSTRFFFTIKVFIKDHDANPNVKATLF